MIGRARAVRISKLMSFALRHDPGALGLVLDPAGWVTVSALGAAPAARGEPATLDEIREVVTTSDKQRFALSEDGTQIRANQGHSVEVDLGLPPLEPPELLFHGTVERFLASIAADGLVPGARTHVHLSADEDTARAVGGRRGAAVVLHVRARAMFEEGFLFHRAENGVWLTKAVPARFLMPRAPLR